MSTTTSLSIPSSALGSSATAIRVSTPTSVSTRTTSELPASLIFPALDPTPYGGPNLNTVPSPQQTCSSVFSAKNLTLIVRANSASTPNFNSSYSSAFAKCCSPQPVYVYADTCLLWCPYFSKPGESQNMANQRLDTCFRYNGFFGSYSLSVGDRVEVYPNGSTTTTFAIVATADPTWTSTGVRSTGAAATAAPFGMDVASGKVTGFAKSAVLALPIIAGVLGAALV